MKNTIIILTSNIGSNYIIEGIDENGEISEQTRQDVEMLLKQNFRPEFLNRIDEIVFYKPLAKSEIFLIVELLIKDLQKRLKDRQLTVMLTDKAKQYIVEGGYDNAYGARPLKRFLQSKIETLIARKIIEEDISPNTKLIVDYEQNKLTVKLEK